MAPRVHNSGHWTIEGAVTSQFENHLRAVLGLPLGSAAPAGHCAMLNLIGDLPESAEVLAVPDAHLHLYGKSPRPGRKLGHVTLRAASPERLALRLSELPPSFTGPASCSNPPPTSRLLPQPRLLPRRRPRPPPRLISAITALGHLPSHCSS